MVPNQESKEAVAQVLYCFWPKSFDYMDGMSRSIVMHSHGEVVSSPLSICLVAFFAQHDKGNVKPLSSDWLGLLVCIYDTLCCRIKETGSITFTSLQTCVFWALVIPDASIVKIETCSLDCNHKPRSHHQL